HGFGDAGEDGDRRWDGHAGVDEGLERAEALAAAELHRADLGDRARRGRGARGLEVEDAERDLGEGLAHVVERPLQGQGHRTRVGEHTFDDNDTEMTTTSRMTGTGVRVAICTGRGGATADARPARRSAARARRAAR